jgi:hypothetical protein
MIPSHRRVPGDPAAVSTPGDSSNGLGVHDSPIFWGGVSWNPTPPEIPMVMSDTGPAEALNDVVRLLLFAGVSWRPSIGAMKISHDVMSVPGRLAPVAPFVVIVPKIVYPFWAAG